MVITWLNPDGKVTLSQRTAPGEIMPTVDSSPPRVATLSESLSIVCTEFLGGYAVPDRRPDHRIHTELCLHDSGTYFEFPS